MTFSKSLYNKHFQKKVCFCEDFVVNEMKPGLLFVYLFMETSLTFQ